MKRGNRTIREEPEPTQEEQRAARAAAHREIAKHQRLLDRAIARRARPPLPYASSLAQVTCICQRVHPAAQEVITCECGRRWTATEPSPMHR